MAQDDDGRARWAAPWSSRRSTSRRSSRRWPTVTSMRRSRCGRPVTRRTARTTSRRPAPSSTAASSGIIGNIGWFTPSYVVEENPDYATWEGFKDNADEFATAETGDKGRFLGADTTYSIFDEADHREPRLWTSRSSTAGSEAASLAALDKAYENEDPILMYWWTPQWANAKYDLVEVELPAYDEECASDRGGGSRCGGRLRLRLRRGRPVQGVQRRASRQGRGGVRVPVQLRLDRGRPERGRPGDPGGDGPGRGGTDMDRREPGHGGELVACSVSHMAG